MRCSILSLLLGSFTCAACAHTPLPSGRYLYELTCEANVERFDTLERKRAGAYDLANSPGAQDLIPRSEGVLEGCLAGATVFDARTHVVHTVVRTSWEPSTTGTFSYRVLSFSVPDLTLVGNAPAGSDLEEPPRAELKDGRVRIVPPHEPWVTELDLSGFGPEHRAVPNRILEFSGGRTLLSLSESSGNVFAVADSSSRTLVRLENPPRTDYQNIHLSPGGSAVLVEELSSAATPAPRTGRLVIHDASTGRFVKALVELRIVGLYYLALAPTGVALYQKMDQNEFVDLGMTFPADPVVFAPRPDLIGPAVFFSDR